MKEKKNINALEMEIENIKNQIIEKYKPNKIILFGSAAKGEFKEDSSDLDFFIVKDNAEERSIDRCMQLRDLVDYNEACDFIVYSTDEVNTSLNIGDPIIKDIYEHGRLLYG